MKKTLALLLALVMCLPLAACGANKKYAPLLDALDAGSYERVKREMTVLSPEFQEEQTRLTANDALLERYGEVLARLAGEPESPRNANPEAEAPWAEPSEKMPAVSADSGWNERKLSDEALEKLMNATPETMREQISTVADARALLDKKFPNLWMNAMSSLGMNTCYNTMFHPACILDSKDAAVGRPDIANTLMWLVEDDLPVGMILAVILDDGEMMAPLATANYLRTDTGYIMFDPVLGMQGDQDSRLDLNTLPEADADSLEAYMDMVSKDGGRLWKAYGWEGSSGISLVCQDIPRRMEIIEPAVASIYHNHRFDNATVYADPENIGKYDLSQHLGGVTLTAEQARDLVGAPPEAVKKAVRTAGDMLMYMLAANITDSHGDRIFPGSDWHYNLNAFEVMEKNVGNCGSSANLANYLLEGDYDEVGFILQAYYPGNGGGHVYNYFVYAGKYYIVDFSSYIFSNYNPMRDFPVMECDSLEEYGGRVNERYGGVCLVLSHTSPGQHLPNIFDDANKAYVLPEGAEYTVLYQDNSSSAYHVGEAPLPEGFPDWKQFG